MQRQSVSKEPFCSSVLGEIQNAEDVPFQMHPAELRPALVILQVAAEPVAAQDSLKHRSQHPNQQFRSARSRDGVHHKARGDEGR